MDRDRPLFILAGICPYENRGCEAIIRGTVKILRNSFKDPLFVCVSNPQNTDFNRQSKDEYDESITHKKMNTIHYFGDKTLFQRIFFKLDKRERKFKLFNEMLPYLDDASAVLSVGGDNYSLDYGIPQIFTDLDDIVLERKRPLILWGASIGPFDKLPEYERYMIDHLRKITGIFARESATVDYLTKIGITENVYQVADPAFLMDPVVPRDRNKSLTIEQDAIGLNLSPLMANYVTAGDLDKWERIAANIINEIAKKTSRPIYLIPHVTTPISNDFTFLETVRNMTDAQIKNDIHLIPPDYDAAETKWIISSMCLFAGARTHSTIAAFSSYIPTLSFAYSIKAKGINRDIFGHEEYCVTPDQLSPEIVTKHIKSMLANSDEVKNVLKEKIPIIQKNAMNAGKYLKGLLDQS